MQQASLGKEKSSELDPSFGVMGVWVQTLVMKLVSLSKTLIYIGFSSPRSKRVLVREEIVLVIDLIAWCTVNLAAQALHYPGSWDGLRGETKWTSDNCIFLMLNEHYYLAETGNFQVSIIISSSIKHITLVIITRLLMRTFVMHNPEKVLHSE